MVACCSRAREGDWQLRSKLNRREPAVVVASTEGVDASGEYIFGVSEVFTSTARGVTICAFAVGTFLYSTNVAYLFFFFFLRGKFYTEFAETCVPRNVSLWLLM